MQKISRDGVALAYQEQGQGGPPMVFVHGWSCDHRYFAPQIERFSRDHRTTILLASHNMNEVERLCERVIIMKQGRIEDEGTPAQLLSRYGRENLEDVFLDVARGRQRAGVAK